MAADEAAFNGKENLLETLLADFRERYVEEHGEEPPEAILHDARRDILRSLAKKGRDEHRDVYDALADE
ncbi:hypothetical protein Halru_2620 [Halovivax ruber XH-70]|uniref:Uncharacterized protein n=2 Tax=Halovivax TaxID=332951 RepID=L0IED1_HALRX|nr:MULTISPECIES: hypothetical protein [Halovivax]AGB17198.1 hypothetical protein Halru_2620 [Halovivax ruber XH-70]ELZ09428.1 hypothetical protein C479_11430 [Halovivax asiaticus JCM 14624]